MVTRGAFCRRESKRAVGARDHSQSSSAHRLPVKNHFGTEVSTAYRELADGQVPQADPAERRPIQA